jgi:hypothetical protein
MSAIMSPELFRSEYLTIVLLFLYAGMTVQTRSRSWLLNLSSSFGSATILLAASSSTTV